MNHISLFSGIGGFDLAAEWAGWKNIAHCEINPFGQKVLNYYWPEAESITDIKKHDFSKYDGTVDIITGGFPCQGFSLAGKRLGTDDDRYLWPEMLRAIRESKPTWVIGENVAGILSMEDKSGVWGEVFPVMEGRTIVRYDTIDHYEAIYTRQAKMLVSSICEDLEKEGYEVQPIAIPAGAIGAPHKRERIWFLAHSRSNGSYCTKNRQSNHSRDDRSSSGKNSTEQFEGCGCEAAGEVITNTDSQSLPKDIERSGGKSRPEGEPIRCFVGSDGKSRDAPNSHPNECQSGVQLQEQSRESAASDGRIKNASDSDSKRLQESACGEQQGFSGENGSFKRCKPGRKFAAPNGWDNFPTQPPVCSGDDELSSRLDGITFSSWRSESIKAGGNAIVVKVAYEYFDAINKVMSQ